jgi:hypothetical protein
MLKKIKQKLLTGAVMGAVMLVGTVAAQATHIDELGINISVVSSDGAGNFVLRYDQYFGADSITIWNGSQWGNFGTVGACTSAADCDYSTSLTINLDSGPGVLSPTGSVPVLPAFQGLVDSTGTHLAGFWPSPVFQQR